eukprot:CAMPEP_0113414586 /NCGR_PEP_ID=MMETSP0013_2-20120614/24098_1 /TAXON_ID=2843 ORGANISM="Skeletonema costatum, Strain 1716" /NCGR_SAMPLE_ID=MMETSP0013_2 /ASSEMBLY_ACC=CAM_ASM_000158 /LENGTH=305 /DNA_ID=CAMNT_0000301457 /DNA_START=94 /DNA_END=1011 /DNA_ORIENTATION=- /assembly_acc=CAM_ASM_000158
MEASINTTIADVKTKEQKREEGRRRALEMAIAKQSNESNTCTPNNKRRGNRKSDRHGARNQHRHKHFAKWILDKFPHVVRECSSSSSTDEATMKNMHVLDIAGGKGELSARLALCHSLRVVMIDPRPADVASVYLNSVVPKLPKKWQHSLEERLKHTPSFVEDELDKRFSQLVTYFSVASDDDICSDDGDDVDDCKVLFEDEAVEKAVRNASLIIGLHADGATEAIVDAALRYNKPFVIVPCCVFPTLFRHRFIYVDDDDGNEKKKVAVRTHEQFCQYLLDRDDRFRQEVLPFEGRNVAIWWDGK